MSDPPSDSNTPQSSASLGFRDWTGNRGALDREIQWLRDAFIKHLGQDYWNSRNEYPHPNQAVNTLLFYEGNGRIGSDGINIVNAPGISQGITWLPALDADPVGYPNSNISSLGSSSFSHLLLNTRYASGNFSQMRLYDDASQVYAQFYLSTSVGTARAELVGDKSVGGFYFSLLNAPLALSGVTSDFTNIGDGMLWYRSDTDTFRARINGVTVDLLHSGSVIVMTNLDLPYASVAVNTTTTSSQTFIDVDASGASRTITLPSAATLTSGFTYVIRKLDATNNTVIVDPNGTETINGVTTYTLKKQYETVTIVSNGTNWDIWSAYNNDGFRATTTTATTTIADRTVSVDATAGAYTVTLVTAVGNAGLTQVFKKIGTDTNIVTIDGNASETIDGVATIGLSSPNQFFQLTSNGANWLITGAG